MMDIRTPKTQHRTEGAAFDNKKKFDKLTRETRLATAFRTLI